MKTQRRNDNDRRMWVQNDEGLYLWWQRSGKGLYLFVQDNREQIDRIIDKALNVKPRS